MAAKYSRRILNVGCGNDSYGTDRIDICKSKTTTKVADLEKQFPYKGSFFDEVLAKFIFEHMTNLA
jgi:hypothetical protein